MTSHRKAHNSSRRIFTIALAACLVLALGTVAFATGMLGLRNNIIEDSTHEQQVFVQNSDGSYGTAIVSTQEISLAGTVGSAEYEASNQWLAWFNDYMASGIKIEDHWSPADPAYTEVCRYYPVFDNTMLDKLVEISSAYNLKLHDDMRDLTDMRVFENVLDFSVLMPCGGYIYEDGSMLLDCEYNGEVVQVLRNIAGTLPAAFLQVWNVDENAEIAYTNRNGNSVEILLPPELGTAKLFYADADAYIILNAFVYTEEDAKAVADAVDFSALCTAAG